MKTLLLYNYFLCKISLNINTSINLKKHTSSIRVRYSETDQMQVVYHGNYAQYFEIGRTEWLRSMGIPYKTMEKEGIMLPVVSLSFKFIRPALYDDLLTINTILKKTPTVKIEIEHEILNQKNELLCTGVSVLAFINTKTKRPTRCPNNILEKLDL